MERKEKPEIPAKPRKTVLEKARNFDRVVAEVSEVISNKSIQNSWRESDIYKANIRYTIEISANGTDEAMGETDIASDHLIDENEVSVVEDSSDDSIYYVTEELGEHIYDEITEQPGLTNIVDEILAVEEYYIDRLNFTMDNYVHPSRLMGDAFIKTVFGNIEQIKQFHEDIFYPDLKECNRDLVRILECFSSHIKAGHFYIYVVYAMNKKRSDEERHKPAFKSFIEERQNQIGDKLGLNSLLTEPFQRFFKYQNLIESLLKKIKKNELNFMEIAATSKALHDVKKLLNTANKSMAITEIVDSKINLMNQGNFLTQNEFNIFDHNHKTKYKGNIFVFQNCVVCTERITPSKLQFKAYFRNGTSQTECINENKFLLYEQNNYKIEISSEANKIQQMMNQVRQVLNENRSSILSDVSSNRSTETKVPIRQTISEPDLSTEHCKRSASCDSLNTLCETEASTTIGEHRKSNSSGESVEYGGFQSDESNEKLQFRLMIKNFDKLYEKVANKVPTSTLPRESTVSIDTFATNFLQSTNVHQTASEIIHEMLTMESDYIRQLTVGLQTYLVHDHANITDAISVAIKKIFGNIQQIRDFHENTFHSTLSGCNNDVTKIANVFIKFTQEGLFSNYILYAMNHSNTQSLRSMRPYREFFELRQKEVDDTVKAVEFYLFLPFQHLPKYQVFMDRIINTLNIDNETATMAACSKAVKNVERLIKDMHNSWTTSNVHVRRRPIRKLSHLVLNGIQSIRRH